MCRIFLIAQSFIYVFVGYAQAQSTVEAYDRYFKAVKAEFQKAFVQQKLLRGDITDQDVIGFFNQQYKAKFDEAINYILANNTPANANLSFSWVFNIKGFEREFIGKIEQAKKNPFETYFPVLLDSNIEKQVRDNLPDDSVLIEFAKIAVPDTDGTFKYVAWIVLSKKAKTQNDGQPPIVLVDLGDDDTIDEKVHDAYDEISRPMRGNRSNEAQCLSKLKSLYGVLLTKVPKAMLERSQWLLSPVADLWLVPFAALPAPKDENKFVLELHKISYLISGRELITQAKVGQSSLKEVVPLIIGDPLFSSSANSVTKLEPVLFPWQRADSTDQHPLLNDVEYARFIRRRRLSASQCPLPCPAPLPPPPIRFEKSHMILEEFLVRPRSLLSVFGGTDFRPDPGFSIVVSLVGKSLNAGQNAMILKEKASEPFVRDHFRNNKNQANVISFVTHGFFLPTPKKEIRKENLVNNPNPLKRCGLGFAGARNTIIRLNLTGGLKAPVEADDETDGIMTAFEFTNTRMSGVDLVLLIACQGGNGNIVSGDSMATVRHSMQLAGGRFVVASSWDIPSPTPGLENHATNVVFREFCKDLKAGGNLAYYSEKLHNAQKRIIEVTGIRHPFFWAAYSITGY